MYPSIVDKHQRDSLITPFIRLEYLKKVGRFPTFSPPETVIICYNSFFLKDVLEKYKHLQCDGCFFKTYFLSEYPGMAIGDFGIGAPSIVSAVELLIAWGVNRFICIGTAGSLQPTLKIGDVIVCERSIRNEGISNHYLPIEKYAHCDEGMIKSLTSLLKQSGIPFHLGTSWTIDAIYRQSKEEIQLLQSEGVLVVEMESSALFAISKFYNISIGSLFVVSDDLSKLEWLPEFNYLKINEICHSLLLSILTQQR